MTAHNTTKAIIAALARDREDVVDRVEVQPAPHWRPQPRQPADVGRTLCQTWGLSAVDAAKIGDRIYENSHRELEIETRYLGRQPITRALLEEALTAVSDRNQATQASEAGDADVASAIQHRRGR